MEMLTPVHLFNATTQRPFLPELNETLRNTRLEDEYETKKRGNRNFQAAMREENL